MDPKNISPEKAAAQARKALLSGFISFDLILLFLIPGPASYLACLGGVGAIYALFAGFRALGLIRVLEIREGSARKEAIIGLAFAILGFMLFVYFLLASFSAGLGLVNP